MSQTKAQLVSGTTAQDLTVDNINTTSINSGQASGRKNIIINGAMNVAQRGTSATSTGHQTVDRMNFGGSWPGSAITQSQSDVASETTPYTLGFRKAYKIVNSNQSSAGAAYYIVMTYKTESQDLATSGWNYKSASSYITVSFWVKSSVAQNFYVRFQTKDGGSTYNYPFETGSLTADTWTKVTHSIPGNSNLTIDNDNGEGPKIQWAMYRGSNDTSSSVTLNQWAAYSDGTKTPDYTAAMDDWFLTNGATFEITGLQLEVGSTATDFEHRSIAEELALCQRYYIEYDADLFQDTIVFSGLSRAGTAKFFTFQLPASMRTDPTITRTGNIRMVNLDDKQQVDGPSDGLAIGGVTPTTQLIGTPTGSGDKISFYYNGSISGMNDTGNCGYMMMFVSEVGSQLTFSAEL